MTLYAVASGAEFFGLYEAETMEKAICYALATKGGYDGLSYDVGSDTLKVQGSALFVDKLDGLYYDLKGMIDCSTEVAQGYNVYANDAFFIEVPETYESNFFEMEPGTVRYVDKATAIKIGA